MELKFEYIHPSRYRIVGTDVTMNEEEARDLMVNGMNKSGWKILKNKKLKLVIKNFVFRNIKIIFV